jgi:hypothetical protein
MQQFPPDLSAAAMAWPSRAQWRSRFTQTQRDNKNYAALLFSDISALLWTSQAARIRWIGRCAGGAFIVPPVAV